MTSPRLRARRGFTLLEMIVAMSLLLAILGMSSQLFRRQSSLVSGQAGRLDAMQNSRFGLESLDRDLRMAGVGIVDAQPLIVAATATSIVFNADLVAPDTGDLNAVYINPDADSASAGLMRPSQAITLPGTTMSYPDSLYAAQSLPSLAETVMYWLARDSTSSRNDEYILFRRVNNRTPRVVARGILYSASDTLFQYFKADTTGTITPVATSALPLTHRAAIHGSPADTGRFATIDSVRQVRVNLVSIYKDPRTGTDAVRRLSMTIHVMNAGLVKHDQCGDNPIAPVSPTAVVTPADALNPQTFVTLMWPKSADEGGGERDVERYALYRRLSSVTTFDQPFASIPAGGATGTPPKYSFTDTDINSGQSWIYGIAAQDCSPSLSTPAVTSAVVIP